VNSAVSDSTENPTPEVEPEAPADVQPEPVAAPEEAPAPADAAPAAAAEPEDAPAAEPAADDAADAPAVEEPASAAEPAADQAPAAEAAAVAEPTAGEEPAAAAPAAETSAEAPAAQEPDAAAEQTTATEPAAAAPPVPRPGPRPSPAALAGTVRPAPPRPVASGAAPAPAAAAPAEEESHEDRPTDSATFGRVDDEGNVHVRTDEGEHVVGQWAAGTPEEGLAFFVRKFDDLSVEVSLATRRLTEGKASPEQAAAVVKRATESLDSPSMVGDLASLKARVAALDTLVQEKRAVAAEARAKAKAAALEAREKIVVEAESLAASTQWKATGERFKELLEEWKGAPRADRAGEQALWKRFSHARSQFDKHRRQHFARLDSERSDAKQVKESLVAEAEALSGSTDWGPTASAYRDLMARWKAAGRAGKSDEEALWQRFRTAQDTFFAARNAELGKRDAGYAENLAAKEALLAEAEAIDTSDLKSAKAALRSIHERWEQVGHVPRGDKERIEGRLRRVEDAVRKGEQEQWRRTNPEARARAEDTVAQFRASLAKLEKERDAAAAAGNDRKAADAEGRIATTKALLEAAERAAAEFSG
jgi:hypothetical protein